MANLITSNSLHLPCSSSSSSFPSLTRIHTPHLLPYSFQSSCHRSRLITRAGPPGTSTYIFAFVFPLSLLAATIFTSIRIADKLDNDFLEEMAVNEAILEADIVDENTTIFLDEGPAPPQTQRTRNRPKREAEISSR